MPKIINGQKSIESRWYRNKIAPWNKIEPGDIVFFKNSGEKVKVKAVVDQVLQFDNLNALRVRELLLKYGKEIGLPSGYSYKLRKKNYCVLIFLKDPSLVKPFSIDKRGFGSAVAWLCVDDINLIKQK